MSGRALGEARGRIRQRFRDVGRRLYFPNPGSSLGLVFLVPVVNTLDLHLSLECGSGRHYWAMQ